MIKEFKVLKFDFQIACVCMCLLYLVRESWDWELSPCCLFTQGIDISRAFNLVLYNVHHWRKTYKYRLVYGLEPGVWNRNLKHFTLKSCIIKGIFSDSNNIFLWHDSEDINKKSLFPKFKLIPILHFQVMHDYVCFIAPIDYCVE